jgi:hypothetical protein
LSSKLAGYIHDESNQSYIDHYLSDLICQRILQICQVYEDADDCDHFWLDRHSKPQSEKPPAPTPPWHPSQP